MAMNLGTLALICVCALAGPLLSFTGRGIVPVVVGELLAGVVLGRTGLRVVNPDDPSLALLYAVGFATLMFSVGMHVPLRDERLRSAVGRGARAVALTVVLAVAAGGAARAIDSGPWLVYTVIIASSSAAIALPIIQDLQLEGEEVLTAMAWITMADILATVAIPLVLTPAHAGHAAVGAVIVSSVTIALLLAGRALRSTDWVQRLRHEGKERSWAIDLRIAVAVLISLGWLAQRVGASLLVAGFGTGLAVAWLGGPKRLSREVLGLGQGFFIPVFFVLLGAQLNLRALADDPSAIWLAVALCGLSIAVHLITAAALKLPTATGLLATAQVGVPAAVIALGLPLRALDQAQASAIFAAALATILISSVGGALTRRRADAGLPRPERRPVRPARRRRRRPPPRRRGVVPRLAAGRGWEGAALAAA